MSRVWLLLATAALAQACTYKGTTYENGDTWDEKDSFKMKCVIEPNGSWRTEVAACITPGKKEVPVNGTLEDGAHTWSCQLTGDGHISLKQEVNENAECTGGHKKGDVWVQKSFQFECASHGETKFIACVTKSGDVIPKGETKKIANQLMECQQHENGTVTLASANPKDAECLDADGAAHPHGSTWVESGHFEKTCGDHGFAAITGCMANGKRVALNDVLTEDGIEYHCEKKESGFKFYTKGVDKKE